MDDMYPHHAARAIQPRHSVLCVAHLSQITIVQHPQERGAVGRTCRAPQLQNAAMRHISDTKNIFSDTIGAASSYELPRNSPHLQLRPTRPAAASWNVIPGVSQRPQRGTTMHLTLSIHPSLRNSLRRPHRSWKASALEVSKQALTRLLLEDRRLEGVDIEIVSPGESCRLGIVFDILEPRAKESGSGSDFPGILGPYAVAGQGITPCAARRSSNSPRRVGAGGCGQDSGDERSPSGCHNIWLAEPCGNCTSHHPGPAPARPPTRPPRRFGQGRRSPRPSCRGARTRPTGGLSTLTVLLLRDATPCHG